MGWLYTKWWKWLCVVILFYVCVGGFLIPLSPGIPSVSPITFKPDSVYTFTVSGFHTHFTEAKAGKVQLWFKNGNNYYCPQNMRIVNDHTIEAKFAVAAFQQDSLKGSNFDVVINDDFDGTFSLREAVTLIKKPASENAVEPDTFQHDSLALSATNPNESSSTLKAAICDVEVTRNKHSFLAFPYREILYESIRNTFYHVPMWFAMTMMVFFSLFFSIRYLMTNNMKYDTYAYNAVIVAILFGVCGYTTGMVWSKYTWFIGLNWGSAIRNMVFQDIKLAGALISVAAYAAYLVLRSSIPDEIKRARVSAAYNIFAVVIFMLFVFIMPRLTDSLHPGNGGNPAFSKYDLDSTLRMFFYPAVIGWIMLSFWILSVLIRLQLIQQKHDDQ